MAGRLAPIRVTGPPPDEVARLLSERDAARRERNWPAADALRERIRELGWDPIDGVEASTARPWLAAGKEDARDRLDEPATRSASVVAIVEEHPDDLARFMRGLVDHPLPADVELVVVANAPIEAAEGILAGVAGALVVRSRTRLGWADAANLGMHRASGAVIVLVDTSLEPAGDWLGPLLRAFDAPEVGLAGGWGLTSADGREFREAPPGAVDAVEGYCFAVRREALRAVAGFDRRFRWYRNADLDLSFAIRAAGWRAVRTETLPLERHEHRAWTSLPAEERDRLSRRNFYRFWDHWRDRPDLLSG